MNGTSGVTTFVCHWKIKETWIGTKKLVFCSGYNEPSFCLKSTKAVFNMQGVWNSPNMLPT